MNLPNIRIYLFRLLCKISSYYGEQVWRYSIQEDPLSFPGLAHLSVDNKLKEIIIKCGPVENSHAFLIIYFIFLTQKESLYP